MNRTLFGALLLLFMLGGGILSALDMSGSNDEISGQLDTAARQALDDDLEGAAEAAGTAEALWQQRWGINAAFADHDPLEQVDMSFAQLHVYAEAGDAFAFAAVCAQLAQQIRAIGESGSSSWRNIL